MSLLDLPYAMQLQLRPIWLLFYLVAAALLVVGCHASKRRRLFVGSSVFLLAAAAWVQSDAGGWSWLGPLTPHDQLGIYELLKPAGFILLVLVVGTVAGALISRSRRHSFVMAAALGVCTAAIGVAYSFAASPEGWIGRTDMRCALGDVGWGNNGCAVQGPGPDLLLTVPFAVGVAAVVASLVLGLVSQRRGLLARSAR